MRRFATMLLSLGLAASAQAQTVWEEQVSDQIDAASREFRNAGFNKISKTFIDSLDESDSEAYTLELSDFYEYIAIGVCDEDCSDLDLVIYDDDGDRIAEDVEIDDVPIISGQPDYAGVYYLEVQMIDCDVEPCSYGVTLYAREL
ncbi:MAG: hypothetical protein AAGE01_02735 [Pseudomonadota bacterium]